MPPIPPSSSRVARRFLAVDKDAGMRFEILLDAEEIKVVKAMLEAWGPRLATKAKLSGSSLTFPGRRGRPTTEQAILEKGVIAMHALGWSNGILLDLADKITLASGESAPDTGGYLDHLPEKR
jgi:hypothetical protein